MEGTEVAVVDVREVGPATVAVELESPPGFDASPGQFVQVRAPVDGEAITRHYSISSPRIDDTFEITVGVDPEGTLSPRLARAAPGDRLAVDGPFGRVFYEGEDRVGLLASGPGIGPAVGIAERALGEGGDVVLLYRTDDPVHERRLSDLAAAGASTFVVRDGDRFAASLGAVVEDRQVFVYGFEPFVESAQAAIETVGGDPTRAKVENFG